MPFQASAFVADYTIHSSVLAFLVLISLSQKNINAGETGEDKCEDGAAQGVGPRMQQGLQFLLTPLLHFDMFILPFCTSFQQ